MRARALLLTTTVCAALTAGCGAAGHAPAGSRGTPVGQARCLGGPAAPSLTAGTLGVFHAGPLSLVLNRDLAQVSLAEAQQREGGVGAYVTVSGRRAVTLRVDPGSRRRLGLQFTEMSGYGPGLSAVRFPPCPGRQMIGGGLALHARGCATLRAGAPDEPAVPLLIPIGNSLSGCPRAGRATRLPAASLPYLGIACRIPSRARCDRIRIGVYLRRPAILVTVQVDGRLVTLSPPPGSGDHLWQGALLHAGPRRGRPAVRAHHGYWYGEPPVYPRVRVTAYFADGTRGTRAGIGYLHAGYGLPSPRVGVVREGAVGRPQASLP